MKCWVGLACILALLTIVAVSPSAGAGVDDLYIEITDYEKEPAQGSTFDVSFTVHVPEDVKIPSSKPGKICTLYYSTFYFVDDEVKYPAEGYWWGDYSGSKFYKSGVTEYTVKVKMKTGEKAPVGQKFFLGIYWKIPLESPWSRNGDNITFKIYGEDNTRTMPIVDNKVYPDYTRYTVSSGYSMLYFRTDKEEHLFVRTLKHDLTVAAAPGFEIPPWVIIAGVGVLVVVIATIALSRRRRREELPPVPEMPPPPPEAPPAPPEAPPSPPG